MKPNETIARVTSLSIRNFRGYLAAEEPHIFKDLDADIVLLTGANGCGKTAFLEALLLVLTGHHYHAGHSDALFSLLDGHPVDMFTIEAGVAVRGPKQADRRHASLKAVGRLEEDRKKGTLCFEEDAPGFLKDRITRQYLQGPRILPLHDPPSDRGGADARLCSFFQDRMDELFDERTRNATLRDLFEHAPRGFEEARRLVQVWKGKVSGDLRDGTPLVDLRARYERENYRYDTGQQTQIRSAFQEFLRQFHELYGSLREDIPTLPEFPETIDEEPAFFDFVRNVMQVISPTSRLAKGETVRIDDPGMVRELQEALRREVAHRRLELQRRASAGSGDALRGIEAELAEIARRYPRLDEDLALFDRADAPQGIRGLLDILGLFKDTTVTRRWRDGLAGVSGRYHDRVVALLRELHALDETLAAQLYSDLDTWLTPRRDARERRDRLMVRKRELERRSEEEEEVKRLRALEDKVSRFSFEPWARMRELQAWEARREGRKKAVEYLKHAIEALDAFSSNLETVMKPSEVLLNDLHRRVKTVMERFAVDSALAAIGLESEEAGDKRMILAQAQDGRNSAHFSTGQRGQVAAALLIGQNDLVRAYFESFGADAPRAMPHRILILDDISTSYDLSNLSREAVLWRQLAYHDKPELRRQLFIASHHEDLSNLLLDNLIPPAGCAMRVIQFKGWDPKTGPKFDVFTVEPTGGAPGVSEREQATGPSKQDMAREAFRGLLKEELCRRD